MSLALIGDFALALIAYGLLRFALWIMFPRAKDKMEPEQWQ